MQQFNKSLTSAAVQDAPRNPPRTSGFPVVGSIPGVLRHQTDYLMNAWREHGDIYTLDLGLVSIVMLNHPDYAQHILRDNLSNYAKGGEMWASVREVIGDGLVTSEGNYWRRQRRMIQPHFHRQKLAGLVTLMMEAIDDGMRDWDARAASGEPFDIAKAYANITMKVIVRSMFGRALDEHDADRLGEAMSYALDYMLKNMVYGKLPKWMPAPGRNRFHAMLEQVDAYLYTLIAQRRLVKDTGDDLLNMFLHLVDDETGMPLSDKEIRDEAATIFLAGYETTSIAMTWATFMLTQHQHVTDKMATQVHDVLGNRTPVFEDLMQLQYPRMVMEETMRLYPPVFWLPRTAVEDDVIGGYAIKAGQMVAAVPLTIHRHPEFWATPDSFDPENFAPDAAKGRHPQAWMPFGAGQRLCIGKDFALMEGALILSRLMQRYIVHPVTDQQPQIALSTTLTPKDGLWVRLEKRR
ncbi:MAG: cytochrome P450 [Pleurocapsa minor GSE-CHR-MK-17-07R]|jgi:cytochrome P450|nr:cytochrome P450 [Pleurocapsa minor GSE-CHR-MK 17-07R]